MSLKPAAWMAVSLIGLVAARATVAGADEPAPAAKPPVVDGPAAVEKPPDSVARWLAPQAWEKDTAGPILSLGEPGRFDDMHIFAPAVAENEGIFSLWYCGSRGARGERVFRLGLATGPDGKQFARHGTEPVFEYGDGWPAIEFLVHRLGRSQGVGGPRRPFDDDEATHEA